MVHGIVVNCKVANIKKVASKEFDGKISEAHQVLQCLVISDGNMTQIDIKDKDMSYKGTEINKDVSLSVGYSVINNKAYFRLV